MVNENPIYPVAGFKLCGNRLQITDENGYVLGIYAFTDNQLQALKNQIDTSLEN